MEQEPPQPHFNSIDNPRERLDELEQQHGLAAAAQMLIAETTGHLLARAQAKLDAINSAPLPGDEFRRT